MLVRKFRVLSAIIGMADPLSSPPGLGTTTAGELTPFSQHGGRFARLRRHDAACRNRRVSPAMQFGRPRNALGQCRSAKQQAAFPGLN